MTKIRTAEEVLKKYTYTELIDDRDLENIQDAMFEYAKQFIDEAAVEARGCPIEYNKYACQEQISDVTPILKLKERVV